MGASWAAAANTNITVKFFTNIIGRCRLAVHNTGAGSSGATAYQWKFRVNGGSWTNLTASSTPIRTRSTSYYADGDDVTQLLTTGSYLSNNNAAEESTGAFTLSAGLAGSQRFESEVSFEVLGASVSHDDLIELCIDGLTTYSQVAGMVVKKYTQAQMGSTTLVQGV